MPPARALCTITALTVLFASVGGSPGQSASPRIVGGTGATQGDFPYQAALWRSGSSAPFCGATVVGGRHLVTAAHCVFEEDKVISANRLVVSVGSVSYGGASRYSVLYIFTHPDYNSETIEHDIAVIRTSRELPLGGGVQAINVSTVAPQAGVSCNVSGWGVTVAGASSASPELMFVSVTMRRNTYCGTVWRTYFKDGMLCAGGADGEDACNGDSGGPLVCDGELAGIVSWGASDCGAVDVPGVYTDVAAHLAFVNESISRAAGSTLSPPITALILTSLWLLITICRKAEIRC